MKTENTPAGAGIFLRADDAAETIAIDSIVELVRGTVDWNRYSIVIDVPPTSEAVVYGAFMYGAGSIWLDDAEIAAERDAASAPTIPQKNEAAGNSLDILGIPQEPRNLDFELSQALQCDGTSGSGSVVLGDQPADWKKTRMPVIRFSPWPPATSRCDQIGHYA